MLFQTLFDEDLLPDKTSLFLSDKSPSYIVRFLQLSVDNLVLAFCGPATRSPDLVFLERGWTAKDANRLHDVPLGVRQQLALEGAKCLMQHMAPRKEQAYYDANATIIAQNRFDAIANDIAHAVIRELGFRRDVANRVARQCVFNASNSPPTSQGSPEFQSAWRDALRVVENGGVQNPSLAFGVIRHIRVNALSIGSYAKSKTTGAVICHQGILDFQSVLSLLTLLPTELHRRPIALDEFDELAYIVGDILGFTPHLRVINRVHSRLTRKQPNAAEMAHIRMSMQYLIMFIILHEIGHIYGGHTEMLARAGQVSQSQWFEWEFEADRFAMEQLTRHWVAWRPHIWTTRILPALCMLAVAEELVRPHEETDLRHPRLVVRLKQLLEGSRDRLESDAVLPVLEILNRTVGDRLSDVERKRFCGHFFKG
jgi:hypothetical protein